MPSAAGRGARVRITRLDRGHRHLFQPLPWQVATAGMSAPGIAAPLREILRGQRKVTVLMGEVAGLVPLAAHVVFLIGFRNRLMVLTDWARACRSCQRSARVIKGKPDLDRPDLDRHDLGRPAFDRPDPD